MIKTDFNKNAECEDKVIEQTAELNKICAGSLECGDIKMECKRQIAIVKKECLEKIDLTKIECTNMINSNKIDCDDKNLLIRNNCELMKNESLQVWDRIKTDITEKIENLKSLINQNVLNNT